MKINKKLNLVIPIYGEDEKSPRAFIHSTPVGTDIWEKFWEPISMAFTRIMSGGHGSVGGPRVADKLLRKSAETLGVWVGPDGLEKGFWAEVHRLTLVFVQKDNGWEMVPWYEARTNSDVIEPEDVSEVEAALAFFTLASLMHRRSVLKDMLGVALGLWGAGITSLDSTAYQSTLPISTETENTGEKVPA